MFALALRASLLQGPLAKADDGYPRRDTGLFHRLICP